MILSDEDLKKAYNDEYRWFKVRTVESLLIPQYKEILLELQKHLKGLRTYNPYLRGAQGDGFLNAHGVELRINVTEWNPREAETTSWPLTRVANVFRFCSSKQFEETLLSEAQPHRQVFILLKQLAEVERLSKDVLVNVSFTRKRRDHWVPSLKF